VWRIDSTLLFDLFKRSVQPQLLRRAVRLVLQNSLDHAVPCGCTADRPNQNVRAKQQLQLQLELQLPAS
jgi:hypothetical protein